MLRQQMEKKNKIEKHITNKKTDDIVLKRSESVDEHFIKERNDEIEKLVQDLSDLHEIYQDFNAIVYQQSEPIQQIADNVQVTEVQVEKANVELTQAREYQKSYLRKGLILTTLGIAAINIPVGIFLGLKIACATTAVSSLAYFR